MAAFYQSYWDIIGESISKAYLHFLNDDGSPGNLNYTLVAIVPKIKDPKDVADYKSISLCTVLYKIISKTLGNRLNTFLPSLISVEQSTFVLGWQILDNVLVAFETMHRIKTCKKRQCRLLALKLDMSETYDKVEWSFLKAIMETRVLIKIG